MLRLTLLASVFSVFACNHADAASPMPGSIYELTVETIDGKKKKLSDFKGKALLIVNTASQCGYTPQYATLQRLYTKFASQGFEVLAFPSNDFGGQEPGGSSEIKTFCEGRYKTTFPLFAKVHARGAAKAPLYRYLTEATGAGVKGEVRWNFTKFLVSSTGRVVQRFESGVDPMAPAVVAAVKKHLPAK